MSDWSAGEYEELSKLPLETNDAGDVYLTREEKIAKGKEMNATAAPQVEVTPNVFDKWHAEERTLADGSEATLSTGDVNLDYRVKHPTFEVIMEHPSGLRVSMTAEIPEGGREFNLEEDVVDHCKRAYNRARNHLA